jgi:hypothetical protein
LTAATNAWSYQRGPHLTCGSNLKLLWGGMRRVIEFVGQLLFECLETPGWAAMVADKKWGGPQAIAPSPRYSPNEK